MNIPIKFINRLILLSYIFLMGSFYLPSKWNSVAVIFCALVTFSQSKRLSFKSALKKPLLYFLLLFILLVIGMTYTTNTSYGWALVERHLSLLFLPFVVSSFTLLSNRQQTLVIKGFIFFTTLVAFYFLGYAIFDYFKTGSVYIEGKSGHHLYNKFMHHRLTGPLEMHAVYFSFYVSVSFLYLLNFFVKRYNQIKINYKVIFLLLFVFYALIIILLKSALFAIALPTSILLFFILYYRQYILRSKKSLIGIIALVFFLGFFAFYGVKSKVQNFSTNLDLTDQHPGPLKIRLGIWYSCWETIKDNWFLGAGTGDGHDAIIAKYDKLDFYIGKKDQFNAHNMYMQYWINNGLSAFLLYLITLISFAYYFYVKKDYVALLFIFLFASFSMTEATMMRQAGIVFFVLFSTLFYYKNSQSRKL